VSIEFSSRMRDVAPYPKAATYAHGGDLVKLASRLRGRRTPPSWT
jgi:hypothetical protein